jgi:hypothetical protein
MRNVNVNVLSDTDTSSHNGGKIDSNQLVSASFAIYFGDSAANGTVKVQASNDICDYRNLAADFTPTNWVDIPNASATITSGSSGLITIPNTCYRWMRVVWTRASGGSSTINVDMDALSV